MSKIKTTEITKEMKRAYLDYAMSVIVSRALPDVRDGLKPVHRRILYAMYKMGLTAGAKFSKSAKVVGEVLGKYHPHGDVSVYDALVRMAQDFSMRYPLIKGQGNFGSIDGDPPAAMRYTEVKLTKIAEELLQDIEKETVPFIDNFDSTLKEPQYLPAKLPHLLLMGAEGIAVGMATKIPPHNLSEIVDGLCLMIDQARLIDQTTLPDKENKPDVEPTSINSLANNLTLPTKIDHLLKQIKGPDFPTGGIIYGWQEIKQAYTTGKGKILVRGRVETEDIGKGKKAIIIKELPYQVNKSDLVAKIAQLVVNKKITGVADLRDESDREGIRIVIELKRDVVYKKILNNLYKYTNLQITFPVNMVCLVDGIPQTASLKSILEHYLRHRINIVIKRSEYELKQAKHRAHILKGYLIALDNIDQVVEIIKKSKNEPAAKTRLIERFNLSPIQAQAILDMQLKRLTALERTKIEDELSLLKETIEYLEQLLKDIFKVLKVIKEELLYLKKKYGDERKTELIKIKPDKLTDEQLIENKEVIVVLTKEGYIKQIPRESFRVQKRGGKGVSGMETKEKDNVYYITSTMTHNYMLFFSNQGRVFKTRVWEIPKASRRAKGKAIVNLIPLRPEEKITSVLTYNGTNINKKSFIFMGTKQGKIKKTGFEKFANIRSNGIIAIKLVKGDELKWVKLLNKSSNILLVSKKGKAIIFKEKEVRPMGRTARGVKGINLQPNDQVIAADVFSDQEFKKYILVLSENGIGKKTSLSFFKGQHRGGKGVKAMSIDKKTGPLAFIQIINPENKTVIITSQYGQIVKIPTASIPKRSRTAKGVILMRFSKQGDKVASATSL